MALLQEKIIIVMLLFLTTWPFESIDAVGSKSAHTPLCRKNQSYPIHSTALVNKISVHVNDAGALDTERSRCSLPLCGLPLSPTPHTIRYQPRPPTPSKVADASFGKYWKSTIYRDGRRSAPGAPNR